MKFQSQLTFALLATATMLAACTPKNPDLTVRRPIPEKKIYAQPTPPPMPEAPPDATPIPGPSDKPEAVTEGGNVAEKRIFDPKVDILFVIDNSTSMNTHQRNLKKNIREFTNAFTGTAQVKYRVGVVGTHDPETVTEGKVGYYPVGKLRMLHDQEPNPLAPNAGLNKPPYYIPALPVDYLGNTLRIGTIAPKDGGPEKEEMFSPVKAALDGTRDADNGGFYRPDAHLAIVFLTDADDASSIAPTELYDFLLELKKGSHEAISAYGALSMSEGCKRDPGLVVKDAAGNVVKVLQPEKIESFISKTHTARGENAKSAIFDLCDDNFGKGLSKIGQMIQESTISEMRIPLSHVPEVKTLVVTYDGRQLPGGEAWKYDSTSTTIVLNGRSKAFEVRGKEVKITYVPMDPNRAVRGETHSAGGAR